MEINQDVRKPRPFLLWAKQNIDRNSVDFETMVVHIKSF